MVAMPPPTIAPPSQAAPGKFSRAATTKPNTREDDGRNQREESQGDIVAARNAGRERQHCNEMRRPDTEAGRSRRDGEPDVPHMAGRLADMVKQADSCKRGQRADDRRQYHEP